MLTPAQYIPPYSTAFNMRGLYFNYPRTMERFIRLGNAPTDWDSRPKARLMRGEIC